MNVLVDEPHDSGAAAELEAIQAEYVVMYDHAEAMAQDETTAQVAVVRRRMRARLDNKDAKLAELRAELRRLRQLANQR
jgi:hypothetical protein